MGTTVPFDVRGKGQLTVGELIEQLQEFEPATPVLMQRLERPVDHDDDDGGDFLFDDITKVGTVARGYVSGVLLASMNNEITVFPTPQLKEDYPAKKEVAVIGPAVLRLQQTTVK